MITQHTHAQNTGVSNIPTTIDLIDEFNSVLDSYNALQLLTTNSEIEINQLYHLIQTVNLRLENAIASFKLNH